MKTYLTILALGLLLFISSCDDRSAPPEYDPPEWAVHPDHEITIPDSLEGFYNPVEISYDDEIVTAYPLLDFVTDYLYDGYTYELMSTDADGNFSPRIKGYPDLVWDEFSTGYYIPEKQHRAYFPDESIPSTYDVKNLGYINMYRKVNVVKQADITLFHINVLPSLQILYHDDQGSHEAEVIELRYLISDYITPNKEDYEYLFEYFAGGTDLLSWQQLNRAYWIKNSEALIFLDDTNTVTDTAESLLNVYLSEIATY
jgi:hypothetical protein